MADVFSKQKRSEIMSRIKSKNTSLEKKVFSYLRKQKIHFQRHYAKASGKPDIAVPSKKRAVFIQGDFWHGYKFSSWKNRIPKEYWRNKIISNIERDRKHLRRLRRTGWRVMIVWEHQIKKEPAEFFSRIATFIKK